jgi:hypothetical protein
MDVQYFLIGTDGRHYGPVSQDDVRTWLADGRVNRFSRARRDTEAQWQALREMPEFEAATRPAFAENHVPATANAGPAPATPEVHTAAVPGHLDPVACFKRAWWLLVHDFAVLAGWTLIVAMVVAATAVVPLTGWLVYAGGLVGLVVNNLLMSGLYILYLSRMRGLRPGVGDVLRTLSACAPTIVIAGFAQLAMTLLGLLLLIAPGIYLAVGYAFVLPLIVDEQLPVWQAMERSRTTVQKQWFQTFGLLLAAGLLLFACARFIPVALVLVLPICTGALMYAYEDLFKADTEGT